MSPNDGAARPQHGPHGAGAGGVAAGRRRLDAADLRRSLLLDVVEASGRRLLRSSACRRLCDPRRHHDRWRYRTRRAAGLDPAGAADELCGVSHRRHPVRRHAGGGDRHHPAQRHPDGRGRHPDRDAGCAAAGGLEFRAVLSRQGAGDRARRVVARGRRRGRCGAAVEIHRAVFRSGDPDLAGGGAEAAALADLALALSRRPRGAGDLRAGDSLERRSPLGLLPQAVAAAPASRISGRPSSPNWFRPRSPSQRRWSSFSARWGCTR